MAKILVYDNDAKQKILNGINKLEKCTSVTLGPAGKNVIIDEYGSIHSTKDGVTVAKSIILKDPFENLGANAVREVAEKSNKNCGDGTTTSTLVAAEIYRNGLKYVSLGSNATAIKNGIKKASSFAIEHIREIAKPISSKTDVERVCTVSANGDSKIGSMIADVMDKIGKDGTIKVENGNTTDITSSIVEGMALDTGYVSPYLITKQDTMEADYDQPFILVVNKKLSDIKELLPCLQSVSQTGKPLLIIADDIQDDITASLVMNNLRGSLNNCVVKSPSYGDNRKEILNDIAISVGGRVVTDETNTKLEAATVEGTVLGRAKRVVVTKDKTVIFGGCGDKATIDERIEVIRKQIENTTNEYDKQKLQERLAKLAAGIGIIYVGADTEAERKELRDRVDDAFCAAKCATKSGIVAGGGVALLNTKSWLLDKIEDEKMIGDEKIGATILVESLSSPIKKILENAGLDSSYMIGKILENTAIANCGFNVLTGQYVDMVEAGIIDAADVVINEIKNASSIAGLLLTTEALVVEEPVEKKEQMTSPGMMPGMM